MQIGSVGLGRTGANVARPTPALTHAARKGGER